MNPSPDFGVKFGCRFYVASVNEEASSRGLVVGDTLLEVGGASVEGLSLAKVGRMVMMTMLMMTLLMVTMVIMNPAQVERMVRQTKSKALSLLVERETDSGTLGLLPKVSNTEREGRMVKKDRSRDSFIESEDQVVTTKVRRATASNNREDSPSPWARKLPCPSSHPLIGDLEGNSEDKVKAMEFSLRKNPYLAYSKNILSGKDRL